MPVFREPGVAASYNPFDFYLGPSATDPTTDNDGDPLVEGAYYWNTSENIVKFYTGSVWTSFSTSGGTITGNTLVNGTLNVTGAVDLDSSLNVDGTVNIEGATVVDDTLNVTGAVDLDSSLNVDGTVNIAGATTFSSTVRITNLPAFRARLNGNQTSGNVIIFVTELLDVNNNYNPTTGVFTAPAAGLYTFSTGLVITNVSGVTQFSTVSIQVNGTAVSSGYVETVTGTSDQVSCTATVLLAANDTVRVNFSGSPATVLSATLRIADDGPGTPPFSYFTGHKVG